MRPWSAHHLVEFLASVTEVDDEDRAIRRAVELCSESIGAEVGAAVVGGSLRCAVGFGTAPVPSALLEELPAGIWRGELGELGPCGAAVCHMLRREDRLIVARRGEDLGPEERNLLEGMARVLGLVLRTLRTLSSERELRSAQQQLADERLRSVQSLQSRHRLLETLLALQRAISHRAPLSEILAAAASGASKLLERPVWLYLDTGGEPTRQKAAGGFQLYGPAGSSRMAALDAARAAVLGGRPRAGAPSALRAAKGPAVVAGQHVTSTVHVGGTVTGALVTEVGPDGRWDHHDQRLLVTFAEHVSMALTDARTVAAVDEAFHDPLTDLPNRALFLGRVEQALAEPRSGAEDVGVLFVDLDRFKAVNDTLGHSAGDELLRKVAARLSACLRHGAVAGRFGGDEFAVLLERVTEGDAKALAERLIDRLREPFALGTSTVVVGASIGIALCRGIACDAQELLRNADLAMYQAKKAGGQGWAVFEQHMYLEAKERLELEADLESAVARGQLRLEYEPIVRLADEVVVAVRATVHWDHPRRGRMCAEVFTPLAEETGAIIEIGRWALAEALDQLLAWRAGGHSLTLSLELSPRQLHDPGLAEQIAGAFDARGLPPDVLTLSIDEAALRSERGALVERVRVLKALGVLLAVDNFGGGISSLACLQELPVDALRIGRSLVGGLGRSGGAGTLARGAVELGTALGLRSTAEGIETAEQLAELRAASCGYGEGPYFSSPLDAAGLGALLDATPTLCRALPGAATVTTGA